MAKVLFHHRLTPNTTTGRSPAELLMNMNRQLKSRLDLIRPDVRRKVEQKQEEQKFYHDRQVKERNFGLGESVAVENHSKLASDKWIPAVVISKTGPVSYVVETQDGQKLRRHVDQILPWETTQLDGKHVDKNTTLVLCRRESTVNKGDILSEIARRQDSWTVNRLKLLDIKTLV